ncbi:histidine ammonia-lyase [Phytophthora nicotianae P10297]|uniref:Histidine ammonia-lyase n=4 Tax=Phytophthora nicotianae TaxID=4792 RepID=W2PUV0_PHYN3|nr:histidine ammonia-lyase [Phytophthora nicotianae INRA-310]ETI39465.1 histidine ammonia-lyase [Phytophthora nicotianae P1569]ETK79666.1 histidine ammonia-lyase [Phytophthora nicotianae]ETP37431.1 histidine ammonia-lyase [Phytophthora nicotianae P10297]ETL86348.1 histidine ammonia-lyase [Phytophthora nicotianae]ETM39515.1 histidine ammonia-lyase [Phytophthora nicotianae]
MAIGNHTKKSELVLDGESLCAEDLVQLSKGDTSISLSKEAWKRVACGREVVDNILKDKTRVAYGINTGFGLFSNVIIGPEKLTELQENLIRSHSSGTGEPLTPAQTRMLLALRINVLAKGHSGIRVQTLEQLVDAFNADCLSVVPARGTVGASGDLAPLAHLALGMMGEGPMWDKVDGEFVVSEASKVLGKHGLKPVQLGAKEGLAMINGTQLITSVGAEAVVRAQNVANCADIAVALTLEVLCGTVNAFHPRIHAVRPHTGQMLVASRIRTLLRADNPSELFRSHNYEGKVQDAYTLRCAPQVHGIVHDTINFVRGVLDVEMNSATDNPMVFTGSAEVTTDLSPSIDTNEVKPDVEKVEHEITDLNDAKEEIKRLKALVEQKNKPVEHPAAGMKRTSDTFYRGGGGFVISGGNFHGEYPAKVLDYLAIGIHEIASVSERRIERLVNPTLSNLPAFLVPEGGLNSGFMIAHCTAAALVSENKVLTHPSSVDSISTSGAKEDHVSMGGFAARKALTVVEHVETVVAIEILAACQALDLMRPLRTTEALEAVHALVRTRVAKFDKDRFMKPDIDAVLDLVRSGAICEVVAPFLSKLHVSGL